MASGLQKRSVTIAGHRTSLSLEAPFWSGLKEIACARGMALQKLIEEVDRRRSESDQPGNLSSALRVYVLETLTDKGQAEAPLA